MGRQGEHAVRAGAILCGAVAGIGRATGNWAAVVFLVFAEFFVALAIAERYRRRRTPAASIPQRPARPRSRHRRR